MAQHWQGYDAAHTSDFINKIRERVEGGSSFVPIIGAGFSAPAGSPLIHELQDYLQRCICLSLGIDQTSSDDTPTSNWNPRAHAWPPVVDRLRMHPPTPWIELLRQRESKLHENGDKEALATCRHALANFLDYRSQLDFLAHLTFPKRDQPRYDPNDFSQDVIDAFWNHALKGSKPALCHTMLGSLAGALRINLILTTNFDDLLERGFAAVRNPLTTITVPLGAPLPKREAFQGERGLVKLHGSKYAVRADHSLIRPPTSDECQDFLDCIQTAPHTGQRIDFLVLGLGASEMRLISLIQRYLRKHTDSHVYWLTYTHKEHEDVHRAFRSNPRLFTFQHTQVGLFLLHIYQELRWAIPARHCIFPSASRTPQPPLRPQHIEPKAAFPTLPAVYAERIINTAKSFHATGTAYVTSQLGEVYRAIECNSKYHCLWIDMTDIASTSHFLEVLLEAMHFRLGIEDWIPPISTDARSNYSAEFERLMKSTGRDWLIFVNLRETPGANFGHDWLSGNREHSLEFAEALTEVAELSSSGRIRFVVAHRFKNRGEDNFLEYIKHENWESLKFGSNLPQPPLNSIEADLKGLSDRQCLYLHHLVLFNRARLPASIANQDIRSTIDGTGTCIDLDDVRELLARLEKIGAARYKPGGLLWLNTTWRDNARQFFADQEKYKRNTPKIHRRIAEHYEALTDASDSPQAALEAVYHFCQAARSSLEVDGMLKDAIKSIRAAQAVLVAGRELIQTRGFAKGSCRKIEQIADSLVLVRPNGASKEEWDSYLRSVRHFWIACAETMRDIAREVAADDKSYLRHRYAGLLRCARLEAEDADDRGAVLKYLLGTEGLGRKVQPSGTSFKLFSDGAKRLNEVTELQVSRLVDTCGDIAEQWRWYRWLGMLGAASRSYSMAVRALNHVLGMEWSEEIRNVVLNDIERSISVKEKLELARLREQASSLMLLHASVMDRLETLGLEAIPVLDGRNVAKGQACMALRLLEGVRHRTEPGDLETLALANWAEVRSLMHLSVCESRDGEWKEAFGLLARAEARLRVSDHRRLDSELGLVDLYRAEISLRRASSEMEANTAGALGFVHDSIRFLDRAEPVLRSRRRNVWWTTWFLERRMQTVVLSLEVFRRQGGVGAIPFLGLEACSRMSPTVPEICLLDCMRMVRYDSYRLATAVDAFRSCYERFVVLDEANELPNRKRCFAELFRDAVQTLVQVHAGRLRFNSDRPDDVVSQYVTAVVETGNKWLRARECDFRVKGS